MLWIEQGRGRRGGRAKIVEDEDLRDEDGLLDEYAYEREPREDAASSKYLEGDNDEVPRCLDEKSEQRHGAGAFVLVCGVDLRDILYKGR